MIDAAFAINLNFQGIPFFHFLLQEFLSHVLFELIISVPKFSQALYIAIQSIHSLKSTHQAFSTIFRKERQVKILPGAQPVFYSVSSSQIFLFDIFSDLSAFIDGNADAFMTKVSLSSKGISVSVSCPYLFFQEILPNLHQFQSWSLLPTSIIKWKLGGGMIRLLDGKCGKYLEIFTKFSFQSS